MMVNDWKSIVEAYLKSYQDKGGSCDGKVLNQIAIEFRDRGEDSLADKLFWGLCYYLAVNSWGLISRCHNTSLYAQLQDGLEKRVKKVIESVKNRQWNSTRSAVTSYAFSLWPGQFWDIVGLNQDRGKFYEKKKANKDKAKKQGVADTVVSLNDGKKEGGQNKAESTLSWNEIRGYREDLRQDFNDCSGKLSKEDKEIFVVINMRIETTPSKTTPKVISSTVKDLAKIRSCTVRNIQNKWGKIKESLKNCLENKGYNS